MKKLTLALLLIPSVALAGSFVGTWPNIGQRRELDALACATQALTRADQDHSCAFTSAWTSGNLAAECRFVMALTGQKTVWHLEGKYAAGTDNFTGIIWQTLPTCTGFLCGAVGTVWWTGRSPAVPPTKFYSYQWSATQNTAVCEVGRANGQTTGLFYGSY